MEGNAAELNPFRFSSEYSDDELGLVYYNYRYYHALSGRWLTKDPMEEYSTLNMYRFLNNNLGIDQLGLISVSQQQPLPSGPPRTYAGDEAEPLCKGGVCLADTSHNGLEKEPPANSNKVTRTLKISWCCCKSNKKTKFES